MIEKNLNEYFVIERFVKSVFVNNYFKRDYQK